MRISMMKNPSWGPLLHKFANARALSVVIQKGTFGLEVALQVRFRVEIDFDKVTAA